MPPVRCRVLVPDQLWQLGEIVVRATSLLTVLARGMSSPAASAALSAAMPPVPQGSLGLVLTTSSDRQRNVPLPRHYHALDLREVMRLKGDLLALDGQRLSAWIAGFAVGLDRPRRDRAGRPSQRDVVLHLHRQRQDAGLTRTGLAAEDRRHAPARAVVWRPGGDPGPRAGLRCRARRRPNSVETLEAIAAQLPWSTVRLAGVAAEVEERIAEHYRAGTASCEL